MTSPNLPSSAEDITFGKSAFQLLKATDSDTPHLFSPTCGWSSISFGRTMFHRSR